MERRRRPLSASPATPKRGSAKAIRVVLLPGHSHGSCGYLVDGCILRLMVPSHTDRGPRVWDRAYRQEVERADLEHMRRVDEAILKYCGQWEPVDDLVARVHRAIGTDPARPFHHLPDTTVKSHLHDLRRRRRVEFVRRDFRLMVRATATVAVS